MRILTLLAGKVASLVFTAVLLAAFLAGDASAQTCSQPSPNSLCTPPTTWDKDVVATGSVDFQTLTTYAPSSIDKKIRITGTGTVTVNNSDLKILNSASVVYIDGPTLIINNGNLILEADARFLMTNGKLRVAYNFQQTTNSLACITGSDVMIGEEVAGGVNFTSNTSTSANWQNDGGYRYLKNDCINVTQDFQLQSSGSGTGTNGVDVIIECCIEIGDEGANHATGTAFSSADGDDSGNWQNSNRQQIFSTDIVLANGNFQTSIGTMTLCDVDVKVNKTGSFQVNSGTLNGQNVCVAVEDIFENSGAWSASVEHWYSKNQSSTNVPGAGSETAQATILTNCFGACSCTAATCTVSALTATPGACSNNLYTLTGSVTFANAPSTGTLTVSVTGGGSQVFNAPFTSPQAYSIASQTADGASHSVSATFSASGTCTLSQTYTAPAACPPASNPQIGVAKAVTHLVQNANGTYDVTYALRMIAYGDVTLHDIELTDNLSTEFGTQVANSADVDAPGEYAVTAAPSISSTTGGATVANAVAGFNGSSNQQLIAPAAGQTMPVFSTVTLSFTVRFYPATGKTSYQNQATAKGDSTENGTADGETTDLSDDGACIGTSANPTSTVGYLVMPQPDIDCDGNPDEAGENDPTYFHVTPPAASCPANAGSITY